MSWNVGKTGPSNRAIGGFPPSKPDLKFQKMAGGALAAAGAIFTLYGAGSGVTKLIEISLNHFGLVFVSSTISFIFWTVVIFPMGGLLVNGALTLGLITLFGGVPALPGLAVMAAGGLLYFKG